jgi:hypothetical protein
MVTRPQELVLYGEGEGGAGNTREAGSPTWGTESKVSGFQVVVSSRSSPSAEARLVRRREG